MVVMIGFGAEAGLWEEWKALHIPSRIILTYLHVLAKAAKKAPAKKAPKRAKKAVKKAGKAKKPAKKAGKKKAAKKK